jgi:hypothetical protein
MGNPAEAEGYYNALFKYDPLNISNLQQLLALYTAAKENDKAKDRQQKGSQFWLPDQKAMDLFERLLWKRERLC